MVEVEFGVEIFQGERFWVIFFLVSPLQARVELGSDN